MTVKGKPQTVRWILAPDDAHEDAWKTVNGLSDYVVHAVDVIPRWSGKILRMCMPIPDELQALIVEPVDLVLLCPSIRPELEATAPITATRTRHHFDAPAVWRQSRKHLPAGLPVIETSLAMMEDQRHGFRQYLDCEVIELDDEWRHQNSQAASDI